MKKLFILFVFSLLNFYADAQNSELIIAFSPNDCINCSVGLTQLHTFPAELKKTLVVRKSDEAYFNEYSRENLSLGKVQNLTIEYSDSLYAIYQRNNLSSCSFSTNGKPVMEFPLTALLEKRSVISLVSHSFSIDRTDTIHIDSLTLSPRISIYRGGDHIFICDYLLNKIAVLDKPGMLAKNGSIAVMKPHMSKVQLMEAAHLDTNVYKRLLPLLKAIGKDKIRFEVLNWSDDTLHTLINFSYPQFDGKDTIIAMYLFLGNYVNNKLVSVKYMDADKLNSHYYNFDNTAPFFTRNNKWYFSMWIKPPAKKDTKLFSEWHDNGSSELSFDGYSATAMPEYYEKNTKACSSYVAVLRDSFYYSMTYPYIYNINTSAEYDLSCELERVEGGKLFEKGSKKQFILQDVTANGNMLELIYFTDTIPKIAYYDTLTKRIIYSTELSLGKDVFLNSLVFLTPDVLMLMDKSRKRIFLYH